MDVKDYLKLLDKYGVCPDCKSDALGYGKGGVSNTEKEFNRWCECRFNITTNNEGEQIKGGINNVE